MSNQKDKIDWQSAELLALSGAPFCRDCYYHQGWSAYGKEQHNCGHPNNVLGKNVVTGGTIYIIPSCYHQRTTNSTETICGYQGKNFRKLALNADGTHNSSGSQTVSSVANLAKLRKTTVEDI